VHVTTLYSPYAMSHMPSVLCPLSVCLSVTLFHPTTTLGPTQKLKLFGNIVAPVLSMLSEM